jgi:hypothetical protein
MARRKATRRRRSPRTRSLYSIAVGYGNLAILTQGIAGTSPYGMITGAADTFTSGGAYATGGPAVTLGDILQNPSSAFSTMQANASSNAASMMVQAITFNAGAKVFRKVMSRPFREANKVIRPLGLGVSL